MNNDLISREALKEQIDYYKCYEGSSIYDLIDSEPTVERPIGGIMLGTYYLNVEEAETLIAFIKMHEREEIPEDVWEVCMNLQTFLEENYL